MNNKTIRNQTILQEPYKVKLATIVEGNPKAPFSIATTPMCRGGRYSFPGLLYFTLDPYLIMLSAKQGSIKYHFLSLWYDSTWDWTQVSRAIGEHSSGWGKNLSQWTREQENCWTCIRPYIPGMTLIDYLCPEREEEDWPTLKISLIHRYNHSITTWKSAEEDWL